MTHVCFITFPECRMLAYALAIDTLVAANRAAEEEIFTWETRVPGHEPTQASNEAQITPDHAHWDAPETVDLAVIIAGDSVPGRIPNRFTGFVSQIAQNGGALAGLDTGSLILARMGHLDGRKAVIHAGPHATNDPVFADVTVCDRPFALDRGRLTCAGGITALAAMQAWIAEVATPALAEAAAQTITRGRARETVPDADTPPADPVMADMERHMRENIADPLSLVDLAERIGLSRKAMRGRCIRALGVRPSDRYLDIRLAHARNLLRNTAMPMSEISAACGFETAAGFSRSVKQQLGVSPSAVRKLARAARMVSAYA